MGSDVQIVLVVVGVVLIAAGLVLTRRRAAGRSGRVGAAPGRIPVVADEVLATPASEAVEDLVNQRLAAIPELAGTRVDFGTAANGSLEIWIGDARYSSVEEIADPRIRQAVREAVAAYNR